MGKKGKSSAPVAAPTPQVQTPDVDVAQLAAQKALDAREGAVTSVNAEEEMKQQPSSTLASAAKAPAKAAQPAARPRKRAVDPASAMSSMGAGMNSAAILTG